VALKPAAIHQFHTGSAYGDGVTNGMLFTRQLLREIGFDSDIFCIQIATELKNEIKPVRKYRDSPGQILLVHHTNGHNHGDWIKSLKSRLVMVYHNITPAEFFPAQSPMRDLCDLGRAQLVQWRDRFTGAIGDSELNTNALLQAGYKNAVTIPMLVDLDRLRAIAPDRQLKTRMEGAFNVVYVGRIVENKCQHDLISIFSLLRRRLNIPSRLLLVGGVTSNAYLSHLEQLRDELNLGDSVKITGKVTDESLAAIYQGADVFVSMSEHEGFGMPLIEAMAHDVPVIAYNSSNIASTIGEGGLLLGEKNHAKTAALIKVLSEEPGLRRRILLAQRRNLQRFEREAVRTAFAAFLESIGVAIQAAPPAKRLTPPEIRVEGPFDSSYSLALVNREFARALHRKGVDVALHAAEGPGDYTPDAGFLASDQECHEMWLRGQEEGGAPGVTLANLYPPRASKMHSPTNGLCNYAWEESGFPTTYVDAFNRSLTHITVVSNYVRKVLLDNGVRAPLTVSGDGVDHLLHVASRGPQERQDSDGFRFLHVSSCFPRKGVDVLLEAFGMAFTSRDKVSLTVKTFPNIHNQIERQLAEFHERFPDAAPVILRNEEMDEVDVADLYRRCDALAAPSRGEGFGLPVAEAMLFEKPVITTAYGGQMDFCTPDNSWLVDYQFAYAQTHFEQFNSVWAEPDLHDLARKLREVFETPRDALQRRACIGKEALLANSRWRHVAERNLQAIAALDEGPAPRALPHVAFVTTWNIRCGIAAYSRALSAAIPAGQITVIANYGDDRIEVDESFVVRCWRKGDEDTLEQLYLKIRSAGVGAVVIQFNFGFFDLPSFARLITRLCADGVAVHIFFHATADIVRPERTFSLRAIAGALVQATRLYVHGIDDLNYLKQLDLIENVILFPHGVSLPNGVPQAAPVSAEDGKLIACFGYMLPDKGYLQLIEAFGLLRETRPGLRLLMLNAAYPGVLSHMEQELCRAAIAASPFGQDITLVTDYLDDEVVLERLQKADLIVFPYQKSSESSSAAVRFGLASGRPVACTPLPIFRDVAGVAHQLPGITPGELAAGISALLEDQNRTLALTGRQMAWLAQHDWPVLSKRLWNILRSTVAAPAAK